MTEGPGGSMSQVVGLPNNSYKPIINFCSFWQSSFREDFQKSTNLKQELPVAAMAVNGSKRNERSLQRTFHRCFLPSFISFGQAVSEEKLFQKSTNKKQELPIMTAMFVNGSKRNSHSCFLYHVSVHLPKLFQSRRFLEIDQSETRIACGVHVC